MTIHNPSPPGVVTSPTRSINHHIIPLTIHCFGRIELPEDEPMYGTYWAHYAVEFGTSTGLDEAITLAERCILQPHLPLIFVPDARDFSAQRILVRDARSRLALGGKVTGTRVVWCKPVTSDDDELLVQQAVDELRTESAIESGWDNYSTSRDLDRQAALLEAHLVDRFWRAEAATTLQLRASGFQTDALSSESRAIGK